MNELRQSRASPFGAISVSAGGALASGIVKTMVSPFTPGTSAAGLDAGAVQTDADYFAHIVTDGSVGDVVISRSAFNPVLPSSWSRVERVGTFITQMTSANIHPFMRTGRRRLDLLPQPRWALGYTPPSTFGTVSLAVPLYPDTGQIPLPVPKGIRVLARVVVNVQGGGAGWTSAWNGDAGILAPVSSPADVAPLDPNVTPFPINNYRNTGTEQSGFEVSVVTDRAGKIYIRDSGVGFVWLLGWEEIEDDATNMFSVGTIGTSLTHDGRFQYDLENGFAEFAARPVSVHNMGLGAKDSAWWLANVGKVIERQFDAITFETIINDYQHAIPVTGTGSMTANITAFNSAMAAGSPRTKIRLMTMNPCGLSGYNAALAPYNAQLAVIATSLGLGFIDNWSSWPVSMPTAYFKGGAADGIHTIRSETCARMNPNILSNIAPLL